MMRRFFALLLAAVLALSLLARAGTKSQEDAQQQTGTSSDVSMAVVVAGTFGDRSFYDSPRRELTALPGFGRSGEDH